MKKILISIGAFVVPMLIFEAFWGIIAGITGWNPVASQGGRIGLTVFPAMIVALIIYKRLEKQETKNPFPHLSYLM